MKKLFIIPVLLIGMSGTPSSIRLHPVKDTNQRSYDPIPAKLDSLNAKAMELNKLINTP